MRDGGKDELKSADLTRAAGLGRHLIVERMLKSRSDPNRSGDAASSTPLLMAATALSKDSLECVRALLAAGCVTSPTRDPMRSREITGARMRSRELSAEIGSRG